MDSENMLGYTTHACQGTEKCWDNANFIETIQDMEELVWNASWSTVHMLILWEPIHSHPLQSSETCTIYIINPCVSSEHKKEQINLFIYSDPDWK